MFVMVNTNAWRMFTKDNPTGLKFENLEYFAETNRENLKNCEEIGEIMVKKCEDFGKIDPTGKAPRMFYAVQTLMGKRKGRTPDYLAHMDNKDSLIGLYLRACASVADKLRGLTDLVVADAYFAKRTFVIGLDCLAFNLVSRFRDDVRLRYFYNGPKQNGRGRPKKFDGDVDIKNPREDVFKKTTVKDGGSIVTLYFAKVYAVSLKRAVGTVIVVYDDPDKKTQVRKVYFSTDLTLSGEDIYWVYRSRFGIEFLYRDGKQFTGLTNCQARNSNSLKGDVSRLQNHSGFFRLVK